MGGVDLATTPPTTPWYKRPLIIQIIGPLLIVLAIGAAIGLAGTGVYQLATGANILTSPTSSAGTPLIVSVSMPSGVGTSQSLNYQPATVTISRGGTVTWTNYDSVHHTVTSTNVPSGSATFDSKEMTATAMFRVTFTVDGTYKYTCSYHGWMQGTVIVTG